ncbi:MAG: PEGA domain-containing protein [Polyangiaceae bacterium]
MPHDISFTPVAPLFDVQGEDGAEVEVDGQLLGEVPFGKPLAVAAGRHFVTVTERGRLTYATEVDFENGTQNELTVDLPETTQRKLSYGVMATGGAGVLAAGVFVGLALAEESTAKSIDQDRQAGPISVDDQIAHNDAINQRNDYVLAAGVTAGISGAVLVTGLFLFLFDEPEVPSVVTRGGDDDESPTPSEDDAPVEIEMMGTLAPGNYGFGLRGTF